MAGEFWPEVFLHSLKHMINMITIVMIIIIINDQNLASFNHYVDLTSILLVKIRTASLSSTYQRGFSILLSSKPLILLGAIQVIIFIA